MEYGGSGNSQEVRLTKAAPGGDGGGGGDDEYQPVHCKTCIYR